MAVPIRIGASLEAGTPAKLFETRLESSGYRNHRYDVTPDGRTFIVNRPLGAATQSGFVVVQNWTQDLVRR